MLSLTVLSTKVCLTISITEELLRYSTSTQDQSALSSTNKSNKEKSKREFMLELNMLEKVIVDKPFWTEFRRTINSRPKLIKKASIFPPRDPLKCPNLKKPYLSKWKTSKSAMLFLILKSTD